MMIERIGCWIDCKASTKVGMIRLSKRNFSSSQKINKLSFNRRGASARFIKASMNVLKYVLNCTGIPCRLTEIHCCDSLSQGEFQPEKQQKLLIKTVY